MIDQENEDPLLQSIRSMRRFATNEVIYEKDAKANPHVQNVDLLVQEEAYMNFGLLKKEIKEITTILE